MITCFKSFRNEKRFIYLESKEMNLTNSINGKVAKYIYSTAQSRKAEFFGYTESDFAVGIT